MKILFVGYRDPLHSSSGGYDGIMKYPNAKCLLEKDVPFSFIPIHTSGKILNTIALDIVARFKRNRFDIVHYFYGDMLLYPFSKLKGHMVVATIHMDIRQRNKMPKKFIETLKSLDGVVTLSREQQRILKELYQIDSVFIPHGFNQPKYISIEMGLNKNKVNVVVIGSNYRDLDSLDLVVRYCAANCCEIKFHLLGQPLAIKEKFKDFTNVNLYPRLNDDEYYSLISQCDYNFLPVKFATANNALLEAQFLGIKSILPSIDGINDYAAPAPKNIYYSSTEELLSIFDKLSKSKISDEIKEYANRFLWKNIYKSLNLFYSELINR